MRAVRVVLALLILASGIGLVGLGVVAIQTFGSEGRLKLDSSPLESERDSYALVIDVANVDTGIPWGDKLGETTIGARSVNQTSLFVGLAATADLDEYLREVPYDVVRIEGADWELSTVPGTGKPAPPRAERFWTTRGNGTAPTIPFERAAGGKTTFATMNSDGGSGVAAAITVGYRSSIIFPLSVAAVVLGIAMILFSVFLAFRRPKKPGRAVRDPQPASTPGPSSGKPAPSTLDVRDNPEIDPANADPANADSTNADSGDHDSWFRDEKTK